MLVLRVGSLSNILSASRRNTTIDDKAVSRNVIGTFVERQELGHGGDFGRFAETAKRDHGLGLSKMAVSILAVMAVSIKPGQMALTLKSL